MSVELLQDLQQEVRRLFIAGSALAQGDLRIAKLQPQLKQLGESAPVFNRIAEASDAVLSASREDSAVKLLELATLLSAVLHTQGKTETVGELQSIQSESIDLPTDMPYRRLKPLLDILSTKGQGRLEQLRQAVQDGVHLDLRALPMMCSALDETFPEIAELVAETIRTGYGDSALPLLRRQINLQGGKGDARRLLLIERLAGSEAESLVLDAAENGSVDLKIAAISTLGEYAQHESLLLEMSREKRKEVRQAAFDSLASLGTDAALNRLFEALTSSKDRELAIEPIRIANSTALIQRIIQLAEQSLETYMRSEGKERGAAIEQLNAELLCLHGSGTVVSNRNSYWHRRINSSRASEALSDAVYAVVHKLLTTRDFIAPETEMVVENAAELLLTMNTEQGNRLLLELPQEKSIVFIGFRFRAAYRLMSPAELFRAFAPMLETPSSNAARELLHVIEQLVSEQTDSSDMDASTTALAECWDSRWIHAFVKADAALLVTQFAHKPDRVVTEYLTSSLGKNASLNRHIDQRILFALYRIGYKDTPELVFGLLERRYYYYNDDNIQQLIALMPRSYIPRLRELALKPNVARPEELIAIADAMEAAPAEIIEESGPSLWRWIRNKLS
ncbi:HEAT repeat domain-containing protein [Paenibacillus sp. PR3]|uniref:HEAT repeat domain-containing protein n=1 Tax=Paenibacillus terricola TaxID=2763503 RepID=A0ABR8MU34_9BACL|nr:HEAT repeat domain-containing protein [Paenibacillus terricola]MBD3919398.1 HEAT repeat domain-containing protein [Paenibacillus terricola]